MRKPSRFLTSSQVRDRCRRDSSAAVQCLSFGNGFGLFKSLKAFQSLNALASEKEISHE
jgi:hypothetical protein